MTKRPQVVLVTGATRGIGRATALHLAERGHAVVATGRDEALLSELRALAEGLPMSVRHLEVTDEAEVEGVIAGAIESNGRLDALVNNAGYILWGPLEQLALDEVRAIFETNFFAVHRLCQAVLPVMRAQGFGTIVNVGSMAGQIGVPTGGAYATTKAALLAYSRVLRHEVAGFGVRTVLVEPGVFETDLGQNQVVGSRVYADDSPYRERLKRRRVPGGGRRRPDPVRVARRIRRIVESNGPKPRYTVGYDAVVGALAAKALPDRVLDFLLRKALRW